MSPCCGGEPTVGLRIALQSSSFWSLSHETCSQPMWHGISHGGHPLMQVGAFRITLSFSSQRLQRAKFTFEPLYRSGNAPVVPVRRGLDQPCIFICLPSERLFAICVGDNESAFVVHHALLLVTVPH